MAGCTSQWRAAPGGSQTPAPIHYEGALRRVMLLPPRFVPDPPQCRASFPEDVEAWLDTAARDYLVDWKGYELVRGAAALPQMDEDELADGLGHWQAGEPAAGEPPADLRERLQSVAAGTAADGVIVIYAAPKCVGASEVLMMFMIIGMPRFYHDLLKPNFSAGIYDARRGVLLHRYAINIAHDDPLSQQRMVERVGTLLSNLANATPAVLAP